MPAQRAPEGNTAAGQGAEHLAVGRPVAPRLSPSRVTPEQLSAARQIQDYWLHRTLKVQQATTA